MGIGFTLQIATEEDPALRQLEALGFGQTLGRYTLLRRIAAGGMAEVYVARSNSSSGLGKRVAIKKILPQHSHNERFVEMLVDEAKITVSLAHPNIAQVYELAVDGDYFIVMELVEGPPLSRLIVRGLENGLRGLPIELAVHILSEVAKGLDHAHKQTNPQGIPLGIIHRDVSPQNILISHTGAVKLIDFGIARALGRAARTAHGVIKGKLRYLAPEIANAEEPDWRADIYCCGIVLFEALTGTAMFSPTSDVEAIAMAAGGCVRSPRAVNPNIPEELDRIVMRAVAKDRTARYQSAKELAHDLRVFLNRQYPKFVEGELADFMQQMFAAEIQNERNLDTLSEKYVRQTFPPRAGAEAPTIAAVEFPDRPSYKRLVSALDHRPPLDLTDTFEESDTEPPDEEVVAGTEESPIELVPTTLPKKRISSAAGAATRLSSGRGVAPKVSSVAVVRAVVADIDAPTRVRKSHCDVQSDLTDLAAGSDEYIEMTDTASPDDAGFSSQGFSEPGRRSAGRADPVDPVEWELPPSNLGDDDREDDDDGSLASAQADTLRRVQPYEDTEVPGSVTGIGVVQYPPEERSFSEEIEVVEDTAPSIARGEDLRRELITDWRPKAFRGWRSKNGSWSVGQLIAVVVCFSIGGVALAMALNHREAAIVIPAQPALPLEVAVQPAPDPVGTAAVAARDEVAVEVEKVVTAPQEEDDGGPEPEAGRAKMGVLRIKSFPTAMITIDGKKRGLTPKVVYLKPGTHKIVLNGPGGETREINRFVGRGKNLPINIYW